MLLLFGLTSRSLGSTIFVVGRGFSPETGAEALTRVTGGETRLLLVPMALEMESKGRMGLETGKEGIRRGDTVGGVFAASEATWGAKGPIDGREMAPEDLARRVGMLENMGSIPSVSCFISGLDALPSEVCDPSSDEDDVIVEPEVIESAL